MRERLNFVIVGHVDHGKSTLIGRLLADTGSLADDRLAEVKGKELAYLLDHLEEEREQGITIDTTQTFFQAKDREYVIIDAPGHVEFLKNMVTGASQAEAAVIIVDAVEGVQAQTRRHASILAWLGIDQILVAINKMDLVDYSQATYDKVCRDITEHLAALGIKATDHVPISAQAGSNITKPDPALSWYPGKSLLEALDSFCTKQEKTDSLFVLPVQGVYKGKPLGRICSGSILGQDQVKVLPVDKSVRVRAIERYPGTLSRAVKGESVALTFEIDEIGRGSVIASLENSLNIAAELKAQLFWLASDEVKINKPLIMCCATQRISCRISSIKNRVGSEDLQPIEDGVERLRVRELADVEIAADQPMVTSSFKDLPELGRFVLERNGLVCAGGIIQ